MCKRRADNLMSRSCNFNCMLKNQKKFKIFFNLLDKNKNLEERLCIAQKALSFATYNNVGCFVSNVLENFYCDIAESLPVDNIPQTYEPDTVLHVMTLSHLIGGHTRVVEKWINLAPERQKHSVALLNQTCEIPKKLKDNVKNKNGELYIFNPNDDIIKKAEKLRKLAAGFEYVVLHIHMDDPCALIAFGTEKFRRPVLFFNHADHLFWIGKSISDVVLDFRTIKSITKTRRGIKTPYLLGIPPEMEIAYAKPCDKNLLRAELNLPKDKKIILTVGSNFKFTPFKNKSFIDYAIKILNKEQSALLYAIGPSMEDKMWKEGCEQTNGRIVPLGTISYGEKYFKYLQAADLILDSWPMSGGTVVMDAILFNKPVLSLDNEIGQLDYVIKSKSFAKTQEEFIEKALKLLESRSAAQEFVEDLKKNYLIENDFKLWQERLRILQETMPKIHVVKRDFSDDIYNIDDYVLSLSMFKSEMQCTKNPCTMLFHYFKYLLYKYVINNKKRKIHYLELFISDL